MSLLWPPLNPRRGMIYALLALAETSWLGPLLLTRINHHLTDTTAWTMRLLAIIALTMLLGWLADAWRLPFEAVRPLALGLVGIGFLTLIRATLYPTVPFWRLGWLVEFVSGLLAGRGGVALAWIVLALAYIWWRCLAVGFTPPEPHIAYFTLRIGFAAYLVMMIFAALRPALTPPLLLLLLFVSSGLLAALFAHTRPIARRHGEAAVGAWRQRWLNNLVILGVIVIGAMVLASIFSVSLLQTVFGRLGVALGVLLKPLLAGLIWLLMKLEPVFEAIVNWLQSVANDAGPVEITPVSPVGPLPVDDVVTERGPVWWAVYTVWLWRAAGMAAIAWIFWRFIRRVRRRYRPPAVLPTAVTAPETLGIDFDAGRRLGRVGQRLADLAAIIRRFGPGKELLAAATIRRMYAAMLELAARRALRREIHRTPYEFLTALQTRWPAQTESFAVLTGAYVNTHYGQLPEDEAEMERIQQAWVEICNTLQADDN